jgi:hypothetical protein
MHDKKNINKCLGCFALYVVSNFPSRYLYEIVCQLKCSKLKQALKVITATKIDILLVAKYI